MVAFFLQAEDGIRDWSVTGVQTCALPISNQPSGLDAFNWLSTQGFTGNIVFLTGHAQTHPMVQRALALSRVRVCEKPIELDVVRSEERRVGKEWRARGLRRHEEERGVVRV